MSFLKKLTKEFEELKATFGDDKKKKDELKDQHSSHSDPHQQPQHQYSSGGDSHSGYPPPQGQYHQAGPPGLPPLPPGWIAQFDNSSQRWYYVEQATGRTQWDPPFNTHAPPPSQYGGHPPYGGPPHGEALHGDSMRGHGGGYADPHGAAVYSHGPSHDTHGHDSHGGHSEKEKSGKGKMVAAGAGGVLVGAAGGAVLVNALDDSSDEEHHHTTVVPAHQGPVAIVPTTTYQEPSDAPPAALPSHDADGDSVSSSDREEVQEAREDYEEAVAEANDSDASSSDIEAAEEAREEYEEEYEETYED